MYHDVRNFRDFLKALAEQSWVSEVVIVAHSLGARLVVPAVAYVDRAAAGSDSRNISNIILASPDIDRETFERDISAAVLAAAQVARSQERRVGKECVRKCRSRWWQYTSKKKKEKTKLNNN